MSKKTSGWVIFLCFAAVSAIVGVSFALDVVRQEGWDGLWHRKRALIEKAQPEAVPFLDEAEKQVREKQVAER